MFLPENIFRRFPPWWAFGVWELKAPNWVWAQKGLNPILGARVFIGTLWKGPFLKDSKKIPRVFPHNNLQTGINFPFPRGAQRGRVPPKGAQSVIKLWPRFGWVKTKEENPKSPGGSKGGPPGVSPRALGLNLKQVSSAGGGRYGRGASFFLTKNPTLSGGGPHGGKISFFV